MQPVQAVFEIAEVGEQTRVAVGHVVAVQIADNRQVRSIGNPQVTAVPGQARPWMLLKPVAKT